jgi:hypothetical protein
VAEKSKVAAIKAEPKKPITPPKRASLASGSKSPRRYFYYLVKGTYNGIYRQSRDDTEDEEVGRETVIVFHSEPEEKPLDKLTKPELETKHQRIEQQLISLRNQFADIFVIVIMICLL